MAAFVVFSILNVAAIFDYSPSNPLSLGAQQTVSGGVRISVFLDRSAYSCGDQVLVVSQVYQGSNNVNSARVFFEIRDPNGNILTTGSGSIETSGAARFHFMLPSGCPLGVYQTIASSTYLGVYTATSTFFSVNE